MAPPKVWAGSVLLATAAYLAPFSLGFVAPIPAPLRAERATHHHAAHVELPGKHQHRQDRRQNGGRRRRGNSFPALRSSEKEADEAGGDSAREEKGLLWAEKQFPGCSTVLSKVWALHMYSPFRYTRFHAWYERRWISGWHRSPSL